LTPKLKLTPPALDVRIGRWIPTVAPIFGTILGASIYELFIGEPRGVIEGLLGSLPDDDEGELTI